jgi:sugar phosphate isomerase/epimerase
VKPETDGPGKLQGGDRDDPSRKDGVTMQLGIRLHDIKKAPLPERLQIAAKQGFACGHLALSKVISEYSVSDSALTPGLACYLKKIFAEAGIDIAVLGCYLNLATPNEESLKKNQERYLANIRFASLLGAGVVGTETGAVNEAYKFEERNHSEEALQIFVKNLRPVVEYAEKMGVIFAIEPVFKHIVCSPQRARRVLDEINSPNLQIIFDPVNLLDISNYQNREQIFREAVEMLGKDIAVVHIKDFIVKDGELVSVAAGTGEMDYSEIIRFIKKEKPYIHATLENTVPENAEAAGKYIRKLWDEL